MGRTNRIVYRWDNPGSANDEGNALLSNFGFKSTGRKGLKFPVNKTRRTYKPVHPGRPINMVADEVISEAVLVLPYEDEKNEEITNIVEAMTHEDDGIVEEVTCEDDKGAKKVSSEMDEEALPLEEGENKVIIEKTSDALVEAVICEYEEVVKK